MMSITNTNTILTTGKLLLPVVVALGLGACKATPGGSSSSDTSSSSSESSVVSSSSSSVASSSSSVAANPCSDAVFCDDFDGSPTLGSAWDAQGNAAITSEKAYSGQNSVKFEATGGGYNRNYIELGLAAYPSVQKELYGRMMIWVNDPGNSGGDFTLAQTNGAPKASTGAPSGTNVMYRYRVDGREQNGYLMGNYDTWKDNGSGQTAWLTDCWQKGNTQLPRGQWACVEWNFDAEGNELHYWLNGNQLTDLSVDDLGDGCVDSSTQNNVWTGPESFTSLDLGIEQYHGDAPARTVYIDDVAVSSQYIGCPDS